MNYIKIKYILLLTCTTLNIVFTSSQKQGFIVNFFIPLEVEISLDFLKTEIENYKDDLQNDWDSPRSESIIKKAEHIAQSTPKNFQDSVCKKIIKLFDTIDIQISFDSKKLTIINDRIEEKNNFDDATFQLSLMEKEKEKQLQRIKRQKELTLELANKNKKNTAPIKIKPKKIKGARKNMNKLKKYHAEQRKKELARRKELLEYFNSRRKKDQEKQKKEEEIEKENEDKELKLNETRIERTPLKEPFSHATPPRKNVLPSYKKPIPKKTIQPHESLPHEFKNLHEPFVASSNLN